MTSRADWHLSRGGKWRTARVAHRCDRRVRPGVRCREWVQVGERYLDTGAPNPHSSNPHATVRCCASCAALPIDEANHWTSLPPRAPQQAARY